MSDASSLRSENLGKSRKKNNFIIPSFIFDVLIIACLAVFAYYLRFTSTFNAFNRYFLCGDPALLYPYYGGEGKGYYDPVSNAVTVYVDDMYFYTLTTLIPPFIILIGEMLYMCLTPPNPKVITTCCKCFRVPLVLRRLCRHVGVFWLGFLLLSIMVDSLKLLSGRQRPYFLNLPEVQGRIDDSQTPYCAVNTTAINDTVRDAQLSFPSYHSALGTYAAAFAICFVQVMFDVHGSYFFRPILSAAFAGMSMLASYTQWMLYRNAWVDIVVGTVIGLLVALYMCFCIVNGFEEHTLRDPHDQRGGLGADRPLEEARPAIFRWVNIPRLTMRAKRRPPNHYNYENTGFPDDVNRGHQLY